MNTTAKTTTTTTSPTVMGLLVKTVKQKTAAGIIVWALVLLSLALTAATFFQSSTTTGMYETGFAIGAGIGVLGGLFVAYRTARAYRAAEIALAAAAFDGIAPLQIQATDAAARGGPADPARLPAHRRAHGRRPTTR